jgi:hypothetical protein
VRATRGEDQRAQHPHARAVVHLQSSIVFAHKPASYSDANSCES